ncbi:MAG: glycosyltransferase [bacterium]|nr:glycosyltransferase [bacterium]
MKTILVFSGAAGYGHVRAAEALCAGAQRWFPDLRCVHVDTGTLVPGLLRWVAADSYSPLVGVMPWLFDMIYEVVDTLYNTRGGRVMRRWGHARCLEGIATVVATQQPDAIICTHYLAAELLALLRARGTACPPVWVHLTDCDAHAIWVQDHVAGYFTPSVCAIERLVHHGVERARIHLNATPIMPAFSTLPDRTVCARELGIDPARPTVLVMGGARGAGDLAGMARAIAECAPQAQVLVLAGRNEQARQQVTHACADLMPRVVALGYTEHVERVMACGDVLVSKAGGVTCAESMAMGLPMVIVPHIAGHELPNALLLEAAGAARRPHRVGDVPAAVAALLAAPQQLQQMRAAAARLARPYAARDALAVVTGWRGE